MSASLLLVTVAIYGGVALDLVRKADPWLAGAFFFYACANICFAMKAMQ